MAKREDANYLKLLSYVHKKSIYRWSTIPLVVMDKDSIIAEKAMDNAGNALQSMIYKENEILLENLLNALNYIPLQTFMLLNKTVEINNPQDKGVMNYNYYEVSNISSTTMQIDYPTLHDGTTTIEIDRNNSLGIKYYSTLNDKVIDFTDSNSNKNKAVKHFMLAMFATVLAFFEEIEKSNLYPISEKYTGKKRKRNSKKPWQKSDLTTIRFLNALPLDKKESQGGHHASPRYHFRRATKRKLTNARYKNHPNFGQTINVKANWVGNKTKIVNSITYKVLEK